ncbi:MAG: protein kinase domain-containing protein [Candidatus Promineifilaceae bacterium]
MSEIMGYGEPFGDLEIIRPISTLRSAIVYEAQRGTEKVLLKISHDGFHAKLKREAEFLWHLREQKIDYPLLPSILPAHRDTSLAYGKTAVSQRTKYYCVFKHISGDLLRAMLFKNPQPWFKHAGWIGLSLADVVGFLHQHNRLHLALYPEAVFISLDKADVPRLTLLDLGLLAPADKGHPIADWNPRTLPYSYTAPELLQAVPKASYATDVYGIGSIMYEMLTGHAPFITSSQSGLDTLENVLQGKLQPIVRPDLKELPRSTQRALSFQQQKRQENALELARDLQKTLPSVPKRMRESLINWRNLSFFLWTILIITFIVATVLSVTTVSIY